MENELFLEYKESQEKEPIGNVKKRYVVGCNSADDWQYIHEHLLKDETLDDNIPKDICECVDEKIHSSTRAIYLLDEDEASSLQNDPRVSYVDVDVSHYKGTYLQDPKLIHDSDFRYISPVKNYRGARQWMNSNIPDPPISADNHRTGYQLYRTSQKVDPWASAASYTTTSTTRESNYIFNTKLDHNGTGIDVDLIVGDTRCWFGHIEFQNNLGGPIDYVGGNVLKSVFSASSTTGTCDLLDLVLDAPYYLDPTYFESSPNNLLTTRWDGTKVPTDQSARNWWSSATNRSSVNILGGSTVNIISSYTRSNCNGSHTVNPANVESHGTSCASQAYGRTHGWAFNANKWYINVYGTNGCGIEEYFDIMKLFHEYKPNRTSDNTKNPTITSNSWGFRQSLPLTGYYYYRQGADGSTNGTYFENLNPTGGGSPKFITNFEQSEIRVEFTNSSLLTSGHELINSGVIFVCSAGNTNQKLVQSSHADFNNYWSSSDNTPLAFATNSVFGYSALNTINRQGFPGQIGKLTNNDGSITYKTIPIGALDSSYDLNGKERKVSYSNSGDIIPVYCPGENTIASTSIDGNDYFSYPIYNNTYQINGDFSLKSWEYWFNGTSSSCPIAAGLFATILENNRTWDYQNILSWIETKVGTQLNSNFYSGIESTTFDSNNWDDYFSIQGGSPKVLWDALTETTFVEFSSPEGDLEKYFITEYWLLDQYVGDTLESWGDNYYYQFGTGENNTGRLFPSIINKDVDWKQVSCGGYHSLGLKTNNTLWSWGNNNYGQLGVGDLDTRTSPSQSGTSGIWRYVCSGLLHSVGLQLNGTIWTWGENSYGQLGLGNFGNISSPNIIGVELDWKFVSGSGFHTMAIKNNGTLWAWGRNDSGQLGLGDTTNRNSPVQVGTDTDWKLVSANRIHNLALKTDGSLWSWGMNKDPENSPIDGLLGLGAGVSDVINVPTRVGSNYDWKSISCGGYHSAAIKNNKSLWMWGRNDLGQLGNSSVDIKNIPTEVSGENLFTWKQVSCGDNHTVGLKLNGTIWSWGDNSKYQSAIYSATSNGYFASPLAINKSRNNWKQISSGLLHSAAVTSGSNPTLYL